MIVEKVTHEDLLLYEIIRHPVLCTEFIYNVDNVEGFDEDFEFTYYQKEVLADLNPYVSLCQARATGKCLQEDSMILNPSTGEYRSVKDWYFSSKLDSILSIDKDLKQKTSDLLIEYNGVKDCLRVKTVGGFSTIVTPEHPFVTENGFTPANKLRIGDYIATARDIPYFGNSTELTDLEIKIVAHFIAEGTYHSGSITTISPEVIKDIYDYASEIGYRVRKDDISYYITSGKFPNLYLNLLTKLGLREKHSYNKFIPQEIFTLPKEKLGLFLSRLFGDDGWCIFERTHTEVGYASTSKQLVYDLKHILLRFGIDSTVGFKPNPKRGSWSLSIKGNEALRLFRDSIGFHIDYKKENLAKAIEVSELFQDQSDIIPVSNFHDYQYERWSSTYKKMSKTRMRYMPSRIKAKRILNKDAKLTRMLDGDIRWSKITSIESVEQQETYSIEVFDNHTHLVDNIWSHNTVSISSIFIWLLIFKVFPDDYVLYTVPSKVHLEPVFTNLIRLFRSNTFLQQFIEKRGGINSSEYKITLLNGATMLCRIAGQSGTGANLIGLHTPFIGTDESGYYPSSAFNEMQPALNTFTQGYRELVAGVPTGMRERNVLYTADQENSNYTKHRVSAYDNPRITEDDYKRAIEQYGGEDSEDFTHYFLGIHGKPVYSLFDRTMFAIETYPVYKLDLSGIDTENLADHIQKLAIIPPIPEKTKHIIFGIDLGYTEPTAIVILYFDKQDRIKFHARIKMTKVSYPVQEKLIDYLDTRFEPLIVGVDRGNSGLSVIQNLMEHHDFLHKEYKKRLIPIDFSSSTVLGINSEGEEVKSKTKPLTVSVLQEYSNSHRIVYSSTDLDMITELERMTYTKNAVTGDIIYRTLTLRGGKKGDDHFTSAMLCGVGAYYLQNEFFINKIQKKILLSARWIT